MLTESGESREQVIQYHEALANQGNPDVLETLDSYHTMVHYYASAIN
jgi:hypothetical protein